MSELGAILLVGLAAGVLSGLFGIGGGVVIVPGLILLGGYSQLAANGTSLAALLLPVGLFGVAAYYRRGYVEIRTSAWIAAGLVLGVTLGARTALAVPGPTLKRLYGLFLLYVAGQLIWNSIRARMRPADYLAPPARHPATPGNTLAVLGLGLGAGLLSGMFGIGGGAVIVPALITLFHYEHKQANGTSLGALLLPVGLPGVLQYARAGAFHTGPALLIAMGLLTGAWFGAHMAIRIPCRWLRMMYGAFLLILGMDFLLL